METRIQFESDGLKLEGIVNIPDGLKQGEKRPAILVLHGFGSNKESPSCIWPAREFANWGYVTLRFDMRSCGDSEGERNHINCLEQVEDTKNAITFMQGLDEVDAGRIGLIGSSFGAAVTVYTAGVDERVGAAISSGGWGDGERKFRGQHVGDEAWSAFTDMMTRGRKHREETGEPLMVPRYEIVPIPEHLRRNLAPGSVMMFPADTAISMYEFKADNVVGQISPRPLLLLHSSEDSVTPTEQSIEMFKRAG
ncbi:MAG: alpha/beta fold hydrolase, partial [Alphaproteobacteria bacterium]|nr:alpha/beta fold hydrolase [Alphaproteobacteria bacterium]